MDACKLVSDMHGDNCDYWSWIPHQCTDSKRQKYLESRWVYSTNTVQNVGLPISSFLRKKGSSVQEWEPCFPEKMEFVTLNVRLSPFSNYFFLYFFDVLKNKILKRLQSKTDITIIVFSLCNRFHKHLRFTIWDGSRMSLSFHRPRRFGPIKGPWLLNCGTLVA